MSAFIAYRYPDCVQIVTDGGFYDENGAIVKVDRKVLAFPRHPVAIAGRAAESVQFADVLREIAIFADTQVAPGDAGSILNFCCDLFRSLSARGQFSADFVIAAYTSEGPQQFYCQCSPIFDMPVFELVKLDRMLAGPKITANDLAHLGITSADEQRSDFLERYGVDLMSAMRIKTDKALATGRDQYLVGGRCDLTTVTAKGATTKKICTWDDEIGKPIDPTKGILWRLGANGSGS